MVHNDNGNKLVEWAQEGHWLGFDQESIQGHWVFYYDIWTIWVKQSIRFPEHKHNGEIYKVLNKGEKQVRTEEISKNI